MESGVKEGEPSAPGTSPFRLGVYLVEPQRNRVVGPDGESVLQPKVVDVLCALAARQGEVVSRSELIERIWGVEFGGDESLTRAISHLRKVFADTRGTPRVIETIPKRGYRLIEPVSQAGRATGNVSVARRARRPAGTVAAAVAVAAVLLLVGAMSWWRSASYVAPVQSKRTGIGITVMPFSADPAISVAGLAEELSAEIAKSPDVLARAQDASAAGPTGPFEYRLRGDVRRVGGNVRLDVQLIDAGSGVVVWSSGYERPFDPQFSTRSAMVHAVNSDILFPLLRSVKSKLAALPPPELEPWQAILLVTWVPGSEGRPSGPPVEDSYWLQRHALTLDPAFAPAHALYAELASYHALFHPPWDSRERLDKARRHAVRAIELAPYDSGVLYQVALYYRFVGDRDRAAATLERVLQLQPDHPLARIDLDFVRGQCAGDANVAITRLKADALRFPPDNPARWVALSHLSALMLGNGDFKGAREAALGSRRIVPITWTAMTLAAADVALGRKEEAAAVLAEHRREWPNMDISYFAEKIVPRWCLKGPGTPKVQALFRQVAARSAVSRE